MQQQICRTCRYYKQHYTFDERKIFRVHCGHCMKRHSKSKRPDTKGCQYYAAADSDHTPFVSKEYLSKALLEYMMQLDLLPEIYIQNNSEKGVHSGNIDLAPENEYRET